MKCLSDHEIAWSLSTNLWSTQKHNELVLNQAIKASEVYLVFSVNRSGTFFGYARMLSGTTANELESDSDTGAKHSPKAPPVNANSLKITVTPKTTSAPRGKIITDQSRGTAFWEVSESDDEGNSSEEFREETNWAIPFKVQWITTNSVAFSRVRYLRNAWNHNMEIKRGRDGTEIDPAAGVRLLSEFATSIG